MHSKKEGWVKQVEAIEQEISERVKEHTVQMRVNNNERAMRMTTKLLGKIEESIEVCNKKDVSALKGLVASLKDLQELGVFRIENSDNDVKIEVSEEGENYAD